MIKPWQERTPPTTLLVGIDRLQAIMQAEIDELRAELKRLEEQKPVAKANKFNVNAIDWLDMSDSATNGTPLYLAAGAKE